MQTTSNYAFKKPAQTDNYNIDNQNDNWDQADTALKQQADGLSAHKAAPTLDHPDGSVTDSKFGNRSIDDTVAAASGADTPTRLWSKLANMIKQITGKSNWYTSPVKSIEQLNTDISGHTAAGTAHGSTSAATANTIMQRGADGQANVGTPTATTHIARKQDVDAIRSDGTKALVVEVRTTDPISPVPGQIWFRSDL